MYEYIYKIFILLFGFSYQLHSQEDTLIEQLHKKIGTMTLQTIRRVPEWETQVSYLESVQSELGDLLEGQDMNVLLTNANIKEKLRKMGQLEITGSLPSAMCPEVTFCPHAVSLGRLDFSPASTEKTPEIPIKPKPLTNGLVMWTATIPH